jgi:hypothetical protein
MKWPVSSESGTPAAMPMTAIRRESRSTEESMGQEFLEKGLIRHYHARRCGRVGVENVAAREERDSDDMQEIRSHMMGAQRNLVE